jgi:sec-independent protein translocase protein TatA
MIGPLEIAILVVVLLVIFGYRKLPSLGRSAGEGARDLKQSVQEMVGDKADPKTIGKSAGEGVREVREFRDLLTGKEETQSTPESTPPADEPPATN